MAQQSSAVTVTDAVITPFRAVAGVGVAGLLKASPSISDMSQPIPPAILQLLQQAWQRTGGVSEFEQGFAEPASALACYEHSGAGACPDSAFTDHEIGELLDAGVFAGLTRDTQQSRAVNIHAEHALADFCAEVYDAWDRLQGRLEAARAVAARGGRAGTARD